MGQSISFPIKNRLIFTYFQDSSFMTPLVLFPVVPGHNMIFHRILEFCDINFDKNSVIIFVTLLTSQPFLTWKLKLCLNEYEFEHLITLIWGGKKQYLTITWGFLSFFEFFLVLWYDFNKSLCTFQVYRSVKKFKSTLHKPFTGPF